MTVALRDVEDWFEITIPGSDRPAKMHVLHADADTGASVSMVSFPAGWRRDEIGHYTPAEEFVVIDGTLQVGRPFAAGDYVYLPPRTVREVSFTEQGALVVAWFSGKAAWEVGAPNVPPAGDAVVSRSTGVLRENAAEVQGRYEVGGTATVRDVDADVLDLAGAQWEWVPAGESGQLIGPGQHTRTWN